MRDQPAEVNMALQSRIETVYISKESVVHLFSAAGLKERVLYKSQREIGRGRSPVFLQELERESELAPSLRAVKEICRSMSSRINWEREVDAFLALSEVCVPLWLRAHAYCEKSIGISSSNSMDGTNM
jgi:hypothetical protein